MSEKKLWQMAERLAEGYVDEPGNVNPARVAWECAEEARQALSAEPDVVVLGRKLSMMQTTYEAVLDDSLKGSYNLEEAVGRSFDKGALETIKGIKELIESVFHVCLTDDGWKWVEEKE